jgi:hypothetical protein
MEVQDACLKKASPEIQAQPFGPFVKCMTGNCACVRQEMEENRRLRGAENLEREEAVISAASEMHR